MRIGRRKWAVLVVVTLALTRLASMSFWSKNLTLSKNGSRTRIGGSSSLGDVADAAQVAEAFKFNRRIFYAFPFPF